MVKKESSYEGAETRCFLFLIINLSKKKYKLSFNIITFVGL